MSASPRPGAPCLSSLGAFSPPPVRDEVAQPGAPLLDAVARAGAREDPADARVDVVEGVEEAVDVVLEVREQIDLVHQHELAGAEGPRVLERLVLALGDRGD